MIDAGPRSARDRVQAALRSLSIASVDAVFLTHRHPDHAGGLDGWTGPQVQAVYLAGPGIPKGFAKSAQKVRKGFALHPARNAEVTIIHPSAIGGSIHDDGLVVRVRYGRSVLIFAGDLGRSAQDPVARAVEQDLQAGGESLELVTWPHHGDRLAAGWERLLQRSRWIALSVGPNPYGLPSAEVSASLRPKILRTDRGGTYAVACDGDVCRRVQDPP